MCGRREQGVANILVRVNGVDRGQHCAQMEWGSERNGCELFQLVPSMVLHQNMNLLIPAGLCGGSGIVPGGNIGETVAIFEQVSRKRGGWFSAHCGVGCMASSSTSLFASG